MGLAVAPEHWISPRARLVLMVVLLTACAQDHKGTAVATVGTGEITAEELRHFVRRLAPSLVSDASRTAGPGRLSTDFGRSGNRAPRGP